MRHLKLLYALAGLLWAGYWSVKLISAHVADHTPVSGGTLLCLLLFVAVPTLAYVLLFILGPHVLRLNHKRRPA